MFQLVSIAMQLLKRREVTLVYLASQKILSRGTSDVCSACGARSPPDVGLSLAR